MAIVVVLIIVVCAETMLASVRTATTEATNSAAFILILMPATICQDTELDVK